MKETQCGSIREHISASGGNRLTADEVASVEAHVAECDECRAEFELVRVIFGSRAIVPTGLAERVARAVSHDTRTPQRAWWGLTAAAVAALALGVGITSEPSISGDFDVPDFAYEIEDGDLWFSDDGLIAGAPVLDGLSVEVLLELLDELSVGSAGGSA